VPNGKDPRASIRLMSVFALIALGCAACAPAAPTVGGQSGSGSSSDRPAPTRTLTAAIRVEPGFIAAKPLRQSGLTLGSTVRLFNAALTIPDNRGLPIAYLAESLISPNTDNWRVCADGTMETT